jgi:hypothetical protein
MKLKMIWRILRSHNTILISLKDGEFDYMCDAKSTMFSQLYHRLLRFIPNWKAQWHDTNSVE